MPSLTDCQQHVIALHIQADELFRRARELLVSGEQLQAAAKYLESSCGERLTNLPDMG